MLIIHTVEALQKIINEKKSSGLTGFIPTMGALHSGHISLIKQSKSETDYTICSIFVNPTQFNDPNDLKKYPRPVAHDIEILEDANCDVLFLPEVDEIYPNGSSDKKKFDFGQLDKVMEGFFRPGHFDGMAQVVDRLLEILQPDKLFMGQKDFQQLTIVRAMLRLTGRNTELVTGATFREKDGLAKSSRNIRLTSEHRKEATLIYKTLKWAKKNASSLNFDDISLKAMKKLTRTDFKPEYFDIVDGITLQKLNSIQDSDYIVACVACWVGEVRLIDNIIIKDETE
ncbi:MAG TPA: pantoate--beta-alanine ligase [Saprospiraceae bacterium]|nr:pantoate--beta-alanine ligase [Saprospiraceae bacterium]MCC6687653.1 pantoate--beta-alanine ligase [Saprospiraceae bacterium]HMV22795.1 pantoate--beta-alanine ligase [Saprospiraceae bacterium]HMW74711.1 pantoate--beta-alanine ligase [Saprospiraceae bacterium]HMX82509.1 pantoate--beta-alanine ligase [Saprospiraceae bacterium]